MSLPKVTLPTTSCDLPVCGKKVRVRAITLKEEKNLLLAKDSGTTEDIEESVLSMIENCLVDSDIKLDSLSIPDLVVLFIKIIGLSKGTQTDAKFKCKNIVDGKECGNIISATIDLNDMKIVGNISKPKLIDINETIKVKCIYPSPRIISKAKRAVNSIDYQLMLYAYSIATVYDGEEAHTDYTDEEIYEWLLTLDETVLEKFKSFFDDMPNTSLDINLKCSKCGMETSLSYSGLDGFFGHR